MKNQEGVETAAKFQMVAQAQVQAAAARKRVGVRSSEIAPSPLKCSLMRFSNFEFRLLERIVDC